MCINNKEKDIYYSYVMGIDNNIFELEQQEFSIEMDGNNFMVSFPKNKAQVWESFIVNHLEKGFWNEYLANDKVVFLFRLQDGVMRYDVSNFDNDEVLQLCEKLCNRKFGSLRKMLRSNHFYKKHIRHSLRISKN